MGQILVYWNDYKTPNEVYYQYNNYLDNKGKKLLQTVSKSGRIKKLDLLVLEKGSIIVVNTIINDNDYKLDIMK